MDSSRKTQLRRNPLIVALGEELKLVRVSDGLVTNIYIEILLQLHTTNNKIITFPLTLVYIVKKLLKGILLRLNFLKINYLDFC
jgi:hypothetical protein